MTIFNFKNQQKLFLLLCGGLFFVSPFSYATTFKIATVSPDSSSWMKTLRQAAVTIESETEGRVKFKFYPGGVMGDDRSVMRKIRVGQLHGALVTVGGLSRVDTDIQLYNFPLMFSDYDDVDYVRERMDKVLLENLKSKGFTAFGISEVGFAYAMTKVKTASVAETRKRKVWIPANDPGAEQAMRAFKIAAVPLSLTDVLAGLQTGLVDAVAIPPVGAIALQWHTQIKYLLDMPIMYVYGVFTIKNKAFERLSEADQLVVSKHFVHAIEVVNQQTRKDGLAASAALRNQGVEWVEQTPGEYAVWLTNAKASWQSLVDTGVIDKALYDQLLQHMADRQIP